MPRDLKTAPNWCPNAIPTKRGWVDPDSGELLVSLKGLVDAKDVDVKGTTQKANEDTSDSGEADNPDTEISVEPDVEPSEEADTETPVESANEEPVVEEVKETPKKAAPKKRASKKKKAAAKKTD